MSRGGSSKGKRAFIAKFPRCMRCGGSKELTVDHIIPLGRGGKNLRANNQVLCSVCNHWKDNRVLDYTKQEFPTRQLSWIEIKVRDMYAEMDGNKLNPKYEEWL